MDPVHRQIRLIARGRVQGVGFRYFVLRRAQALSLDGEVRNLADGGVEVVASGSAAAVEQLIEAIRTGPSAASVAAVEVHTDDRPAPARGFRITG
jgi:acylphosphatase